MQACTAKLSGKINTFFSTASCYGLAANILTESQLLDDVAWNLIEYDI